MGERDLRTLLDEVRRGRLSRRRFVQMIVGLGLTAPMAAQMLASAGLAQAQAKWTFNPTKRGGGGIVKTLWWQAPTLLNPHFANGTKDQDASRIFYEPLGAYDPDGNIVPVLAAEVPSLQNGQVAKDGLSVTWRLKKNVVWHDGKPFTADDVVFNWEYVLDPATSAVTVGQYRDISRIDKLDNHTVKLVFKSPTPFWSAAFCGPTGMIIPKHLFQAYKGDKSREAPTNLKPVGTGPYRFVDFKPGDIVRGELNSSYHVANRPFFDQIEMKRGGDGVRAKDGKKLKFVYQTSINAPRQKTQQIVKQACAKAGIDLELKSITANVFFSSDPANPDTFPHFSTDLQMFTTTMTQPDPQRFMDQFVSWEVASKDNKWAGRNPTRWRNEEYDRAWKAAETEMDLVKRAALFVKMNDLVIQNVVVIPVVFRPRVGAISNRMRDVVQSGWDGDFWALAYWSKQT